MRFLAFIFSFLLAAPAFAGALFDSEETVVMEIKADFKALIDLKYSEEKIFPATLIVGDSTMAAEIQPRGKLRRTICHQLPPLKVILPKGNGKRVHPFEKMDRDLKMVTDCYPTLSAEDGQYAIHREYLQYKLLNAAGLTSFKVRMAAVVYRDLSGEVISQSPAIFIENIKDFAKRNGFSKKSAPPPRYQPAAELMVAESLIRNFDFFVPSVDEETQHNVRLVRNDANDILAMVPFDFDLSYITRGASAPEADAIAASLATLGPPGGPGLLIPGQLLRLADKQASLLAEVEKAPLQEEEKINLRKWINNYVQAIRIVTAPKPAATPVFSEREETTESEQKVRTEASPEAEPMATEPAIPEVAPEN